MSSETGIERFRGSFDVASFGRGDRPYLVSRLGSGSLELSYYTSAVSGWGFVISSSGSSYTGDPTDLGSLSDSTISVVADRVPTWTPSSRETGRGRRLEFDESELHGSFVLTVADSSPSSSIGLSGGSDGGALLLTATDLSGVSEVRGTSGSDFIYVESALTGHLAGTGGLGKPMVFDAGSGDDVIILASSSPHEVSPSSSHEFEVVGRPSVRSRLDVQQIHGGDGADVILAYSRVGLYGDGGDDVLLSGAGDDEVFGGAGADYIDGGDGDDTLYGDFGEDRSSDGRPGSDRILGGDGNDTLHGEFGDDHLSGGFGNDFLEGGLHNDHLYGDEGDDVLDGGDGADFLRGGSGDDSLLIGDDDEFATKTPDGLRDDVLRGGSGNDVMESDYGNDFLFDGRGDDTVDGGAGDDVFIVGSGNDVLSGGEGDDVFYFSASRVSGHWRREEGVTSYERDTTKVLTDFDPAGGDEIELDGFFHGPNRIGRYKSAIENLQSAIDYNDDDKDNDLEVILKWRIYSGQVRDSDGNELSGHPRWIISQGRMTLVFEDLLGSSSAEESFRFRADDFAVDFDFA